VPDTDEICTDVDIEGHKNKGWCRGAQVYVWLLGYSAKRRLLGCSVKRRFAQV
jgi:hypothetical protein